MVTVLEAVCVRSGVIVAATNLFPTCQTYYKTEWSNLVASLTLLLLDKPYISSSTQNLRCVPADFHRNVGLSSPATRPTAHKSIGGSSTSWTNQDNVFLAFVQLIHMALPFKDVNRRHLHVGVDLARARCAPILLPK